MKKILYPKRAEWAEIIARPHLDVSQLTSTVRGVLDDIKSRGDEAVNAVLHYIDDAILMGASRVRILHGTGTGVLRQLIRQYLATIPNVSSFRDEHVQFGGAGITVVEL